MYKKTLWIGVALLVIGIFVVSAEIRSQKIANQITDPITRQTVRTHKKMLNLEIKQKKLTATMVDNSSTRALSKWLANGPKTIKLNDFEGMEKVGDLGENFPRNDTSIMTKAGDLILYQGNKFVLYYAPNSWNFTRLGKINDINAKQLKELIGKDSVTVTLSMD
ncbi:hypothetical protein C5L30_002342 [Companilactobacillus farciminis]|uniref:Cyclophilin-like domain-containing protein n=1 Tax=Companilactobacillus farciminis TaxID=1612 RepID=A0A4V3A2Z3_9LACO|nr:cyclophilin-like fold protein [Companilactobacillus farciminis]ATO45846.1 hypothetical protein LF20184_03320 [Companilactobacillus farciminis KCTC 3681 = DSM 20184]KRK61993.1 hypothetical protein FC68_GL000378 [Companilactobacillus farciminis KCTC 3681 = DSM 20184]TDG71762.1 hypothetical protein C5L30_002342 [Companilactobacillus farciminis]